MKKLLMSIAIVALMGLSSCGNNTANTTTEETDSLVIVVDPIADPIVEIEALEDTTGVLVIVE